MVQRNLDCWYFSFTPFFTLFIIKNRYKFRLKVAKAKGKALGRPKAELPSNFVKEYKKFKEGTYGNMSAMSFAKVLGMERSALYKYIKILEQKEA